MLPMKVLLSLFSANYIIAYSKNSILHLKPVYSLKCKHTCFSFDLYKDIVKLPLPFLFYKQNGASKTLHDQCKVNS